MSSSLDIITVNIETDFHFEKLIPFLKTRNPDVILMQEVLEKDIPYFENSLGMHCIFSALNYLIHDQGNIPLGIATFSKLPILNNRSHYYRGSPDNLPTIRHGQGEAEKMARSILITEHEKNGHFYRLINTHFSWTPNGRQPSALQYHDIEILLKILSEIPEFVLCGDFNTPRGWPLFDKIASKYQDNIPTEITTTIDKQLHKWGDLNLMVDGIFTTPQYTANNVKVWNGVSDHFAISAMIESQEKCIK